MTFRTFIRAALSCLLMTALLPCLKAADVPNSEKTKIEALISQLETLKGATFVRNDKGYDAKSAAKFLRGKWKAQDKEIKTAKDFIAKAATLSSTSGKPYLIRLAPGKETPCADYLAGQLKKLEAGSRSP